MKTTRSRPVSAETEMPPRTVPVPTLLKPAQLEDCWRLDQRALGGLWTREQWGRELSEAQRPCLGLIDAGGLQAVACGWLVLDELQITAVAVDPPERRRGLGWQVLQALLIEGKAQGAARATLEVSAVNAAAVALYRRCGFSTAGVRRAYYRNGDDALIQWMDLQNLEEVRIAAHS
jgi:ribosomal-protein-alanine N-acetyltransferase